MIIDKDPLLGLLFYEDIGFSHTLHVLEKVRRNCARISGERAAPFLIDLVFDHDAT